MSEFISVAAITKNEKMNSQQAPDITDYLMHFSRQKHTHKIGNIW